MKSILALGCISACALLVGCDNGTSVTTIESSQIRPPAAQPIEPPKGPSLGSTPGNTQGGEAPAPK